MALFEPFFQALNHANLRYVVVGGLATVLHGHARLTVDIDLMVDLAPDHAEKVIATLTKLGFVPQLPVNPTDFASSQIRQAWNEEKGMHVFSMIDPANPLRIVDLFVKHPIPFEDLWTRSKVIHVDSTSIRIASLSDLIHLKRLAGRPQDLADLEKLEQIQKLPKDDH